MRTTLLTATALLMLVGTAYSLQCYDCIDIAKDSDEKNVCSKSKLDEDEAKYVKECTLGTCQRSHATALDLHAVTMTCSTEALCDAAKKACDDSGDDCGVSCCTTDKCNAGSSISFSFVLMAISSALYLALMM